MRHCARAKEVLLVAALFRTTPVMAGPAATPPRAAPAPRAAAEQPARGRSAQAQPEPREIVAPRLVESAAALYPDGASGVARVLLEAVIAEDGSVAKLDVRDGEEPFSSAARRAVERWRFSPATRSGLPVRARISIAIAFEPPSAPARQTVQAADVIPALAPATGAPSGPAPIEVTVAGEQRHELGSIHVPRHEARLVPGAFADPFRVIEVMPGVAPILSGIPYFYVRGAPPGDVGYFIDGIRVPLLFHVGAGPSVLAPALVDRVDLFASAYPARYGRFSGGIMAGETTAPSERARGEAQARVFDAGAFVELPFDGGRGSVLVGGRYSYTQALLGLVAPDFALGYWDYQARVAYAVGQHQRLALFAFGALDRLEKTGQPAPLFDTYFHRLDARWEHETRSSSTRVGVTLGVDHVALAEEDDPLQGALQKSRSLTARAQTDQRLSGTWRVRAGAEAGLEPVDEERDSGFGAVADYGGRTDERAAVYADAIYRPRRGVELVPGLRLEQARSRGASHTFVEPRAASRLRVADGLVWESVFGVANQLPTQSVRVPARTPNALELLPQQAWQAAESLELALPLDALGKLTLFHARTVAEPLASRNYGVEVFLRRDFTHRLGGLLSYTLSRTTGSAGRVTRATAYDRRHVLTLVLGYRLGAGYRLGGRAYYASGRPYAYACPTPSCGPADPLAPRPFLIEGRFPDFLRADVRFEKRWELADGRWLAAAFEWFNANLARERDGLAWSPERGGLSFTSRSPLTLPSVGLEGGF
jgi:TonB family protein